MTVAEWFRNYRGIDGPTLDKFGVTFNPQTERVLIPYKGYTKERPDPRRPLKEGERRFYLPKGAAPELFNEDEAVGCTTVFLCEGETDTMRLQQELDAEHSPAAAVGIGGINNWRGDFATSPAFASAKHVYVILDNDEDYKVQAQTNAAWRQIRQDLGPAARRVTLPSDVKDVCEFFEAYDLETLRLLTKQGPGVSRFRHLDLTKAPPPPNWLLEGLVACGDVVLTSGASGLGKSWLTMGLAVAVADGHETYLNQPVRKHGTVLYVDEENPEDVIYHRLRKLGLKNPGNVRYLWNNALRLDRNPEELLDEALEFQPALIVLDSLTRIHTGEENDAGTMSPLLNDAIRPLARETGAAVMLIHHHGVGGERPRGSSDILASSDGALDIYATGYPGQFKVKLTKSRRRLSGDDMIVRVVDMPDGSVRVMAAETLDFDSSDAPF